MLELSPTLSYIYTKFLIFRTFHPGMTVQAKYSEFADQLYNFDRMSCFLEYSRELAVAEKQCFLDIIANIVVKIATPVTWILLSRIMCPYML